MKRIFWFLVVAPFLATTYATSAQLWRMRRCELGYQFTFSDLVEIYLQDKEHQKRSSHFQ